MVNNLPDFLVVGPPRTGTTWLNKVLADCTNVFLPETKQLHFFDQHFEQGIDWYKEFFAAAPTDAVKGECTPDCIMDGNTLIRIMAELPHVKIVLIFRNPVERALSHYKIRRRSRKLGRDATFSECFESDPYLMQNSLYGEHLKALLSHFSASQVLVLDFQAMVQAPESLLETLAAFLGLKMKVPENYCFSHKLSEGLPPQANPFVERILLGARRLVRPAVEAIAPSAYGLLQRRYTQVRKWASRKEGVDDDSLSESQLRLLENDTEIFFRMIDREGVRYWTHSE